MSAMPKGVEHPSKKHRVSVVYKTDMLGAKIPFVKCADGAYHRYLTADFIDIERTPPTSIETTPAACPSCGHSQSELKGPKLALDSECQWDRVAEWIVSVEEETGTRLMCPPPDHVETRMKSKLFEPDKYRKTTMSKKSHRPMPPLRLSR